jgi:hypothetical protein
VCRVYASAELGQRQCREEWVLDIVKMPNQRRIDTSTLIHTKAYAAWWTMLNDESCQHTSYAESA